MESEKGLKNRVRHTDRVKLSPESLVRLSQWVQVFEGGLKGNRVTKADLVNFLIRTHIPELSERELDQIEREHFDEIKFASWALKELKAARQSGRRISLADIVGKMQRGVADASAE